MIAKEKPCKKPKWKEFEDSDDEKDYKQKLLRYRSWKYSLVSYKNVTFDESRETTSPTKGGTLRESFENVSISNVSPTKVNSSCKKNRTIQKP